MVVTLVASELPLSSELVAAVCGLLEAEAVTWLAPDKAVEIACLQAERSALEALLAPQRVDLFIQPQGSRRKRLLVSDMDSTMVCEETLDELAAAVGLKEKIAAITARSMAGELNFEEAIRARIALVKGLPESAVGETLAQVRLTPGARQLVRTMRAAGAKTVLVSGGFTCFTGPLAAQLGMDHHHGNQLLFESGVATGEVGDPILGRSAKRELLEQWCTEYGLSRTEVLAVGDGANDLEMLQAAGLGVGFHPKAFLRERVENSILYGDLSALLYAQGFTFEEIEAACTEL